MIVLPLVLRSSWLPALFILSLGCAEASAPPVEACADDQAVTVHVSAGPRPAFTWTPACGMTSITVFSAAGPPPAAWVLYGGSSAASNPLRSGIRYGQAPSGTLEATPETALEVGSEYQVLVYRWVGEPGGEGGPFQRGSATFRP
jgi:hypothetical protein